ncbi:hypothetical protein [Paenibacillus sp. Marseille-Q7038]
MNKLLKSLMLLTAIMLIGSIVVYAEFKGTSHSDIEFMEENIDNKQGSEQVDQQEEVTLQSIAEVANTENRLYPIQESEGIYDGFILNWDGKTTEFNWKSIASPAAPAELLSGDVTGDGIKDAIITLPAGYGTGVYLEDIHIVNGKTLREEQVEDATNAAKEWAALSMEATNQEELLLNHIDYQMNENEQLTALIGVAISPIEYIGELTLTYVYDNKKEMLMIDSISYTAFE